MVPGLAGESGWMIKLVQRVSSNFLATLNATQAYTSLIHPNGDKAAAACSQLDP